jgi:hypothetical protein
MFTKIAFSLASLILVTASAVAQDQGSVERVDAEDQLIAIKIRETTHALDAAAVRLLDAQGNPAKLADFAVGDQVKVQWDGDKVSTIQKSEGSTRFAIVAVDEGSVTNIDGENQTMELNIGETTHLVAAADVQLLKANGDAAKLEDFAAGDVVDVTMDGDKITVITKKA